MVTNVSILEATSEPGEPDFAQLFEIFYSQGSTVWWSWTAPTNGSVLITTTGSTEAYGSESHTRLAVFTGSSLTNLTPVASNDNAREGVYTSRVILTNVVAGTSYQILVDIVSWEPPGNIKLNLSLIQPPDFISTSIRALPNNPFQARLKGTIEQSYIIEASTNLIDWSAIFTNKATDGFFNVLDPSATKFGRRFYRAKETQ